MGLGQYKRGAPKSRLIPVRCEVCRNRPVTMIVVDFIFACHQCAKRIETAIEHRRDERPLARGRVSSQRRIQQGRITHFIMSARVISAKDKEDEMSLVQRKPLPRGCDKVAPRDRDAAQGQNRRGYVGGTGCYTTQ